MHPAPQDQTLLKRGYMKITTLKIIKLIVAPLLFAGTSFAGHSTSDGSLTLGVPVTAASSGNKATNSIIFDKLSNQPLWQLIPDPWAVNSDAIGSIQMQYTGNGTVATTVNLSNLASEGANAYPCLFIGHDAWGDSMGNQPLTFPVQLGTLTSLYVDVDYTLSIPGAAPGDLDVGFDEWLLPTATYAGGQAGAVEIMVAPYFNFSWTPAGKLVGTVTEPVDVNGKMQEMVFNEYSGGTGPGHEIIFFPRDGQILSGDVRLNLLDFMNIGASTAGVVAPNWFLAGIDFGTEFGHTTTAKYTLTTKKLQIDEEFTSGQ
jgi:Glycosyl hydrolase family 12